MLNMAKLVNTELFPEWEDQKLETGCHGASVGHCDDTVFINKLSRKIHFDWMEKPKNPIIVHHLEPGEHIKVKPRQDVKHGYNRFLALCHQMNLHPSTEQKKNK